jgi:Peptidase M16 inactive domain
MSLLHFAVAFKGVSWADADSIPLMIMQQMLGGWNKNAGAGNNMASRACTRCICLHCNCCKVVPPRAYTPAVWLQQLCLADAVHCIP